jgi:hypothetical protein
MKMNEEFAASGTPNSLPAEWTRLSVQVTVVRR